MVRFNMHEDNITSNNNTSSIYFTACKAKFDYKDPNLDTSYDAAIDRERKAKEDLFNKKYGYKTNTYNLVTEARKGINDFETVDPYLGFKYWNDSKAPNENENTEKEDKDMSEFVKVEIFIPIELARLIKYNGSDISDENMDAIADIIRNELPNIPVLEVGLAYSYVDVQRCTVNEYEIVQLGDNESVLRRFNGNAAGDKGSTFVENNSKILRDLITGRATIIEDTEEVEED